MSKSASKVKLPKAATWEELLQSYRRYRVLPVWGSMKRVPDDNLHLSEADISHIRNRGEKAADRATTAVAKLRERDAKFPDRPSAFTEEDVDRIVREGLVGKERWRNLWEALVFDAHGYSCAYCGRNASRVWQDEGETRTLWLVVDHLVAQSRGGAPCSFANSVPACWSCNTLKGPLPRSAFEHELTSLARSFLKLK